MQAARWPPDVQLDAAESSAARAGRAEGRAGGMVDRNRLPRVRFQFRPLQTARGTVAVCGFRAAGRSCRALRR